MGKVLITTGAFQERRAANEVENILAMRNIEVTTRLFEGFSGVLLVESQDMDSLELSRVLLNTAHVRRIVKSIVPILVEFELNDTSYESVFVLVLEHFLPRVCLDVLRGRTFCVRCRFRGMRGEARCERLLGYYIKRVVPDSKVNLKRPDYVLLVETVGLWCGVYFGRNDKSILLYPEVQR